ncbi:MAG TPA: PxKF domain-containing protein [Gemmatimonadales bacterium]|nr:PxKF domain-containing protein [Gemmatimonadales bacterium]
MHFRAWWKLSCLCVTAAACADGATGPAAGPIASADGPGIVALAVAASGDGYRLATDRDDYLPGDTVRVSGGGWPAGDTLDLLLEVSPATHEPRRWTVAVDASGDFADSGYVVSRADLGVTFTLTATSRTTGGALSLGFADGLPQSLALSPATVAVLPGTAAQFLATVGMSGSSAPCTVTMQMLTTLPAGVAATFGSSSFVATNQPVTSTLTLTTSSTTAPGSYPFQIRALRGPDCEPAISPTVGGLLTVIGPPVRLAFGMHPTTSISGLPITPAVTVRVLDAGANVVLNSSAVITVAFGANPAGGSLGGTLTRAAANGVATFPDLTVDRFGNGYTLTAASPGLPGATSVAFTVNRASPARLGFVRQPSGGSPGSPWAAQPQVAIQDASGNTVTSGPGSGAAVALALVGGTGTAGAALGCAANPVPAVAGVATFSGCRIDLEGRGYRLRAASGTLTPATSDPLDVEPLNRPPAVSAGGPYGIAEGAELLLSPTVSDPDGDVPTYRWTVSTAGMDAGGRCTFADDTARNARLRCTDDSGDAPGARFTLALEVSDGKADPVSASAQLTVSNIDPVLAALSAPEGAALPATVVVGRSLELRVAFADQGEHDTHAAELDCGGGWGSPAPVGSPFSRTCSLGSVGPRTIRVRVTDDDGAAAVLTHALVVTYGVEGFFEPLASAHEPTPWRAGQAIPLKWRVTDYEGRPVLGLPPVNVRSAGSACNGAAAGAVRAESAAGASEMKELGDGRYGFVWKTPASYAGTCRAVWLEFVPGYATGAMAVIEFKAPAR